MSAVENFFQKRQEHRGTSKSGGRKPQVVYIYRQGNLKGISSGGWYRVVDGIEQMSAGRTDFSCTESALLTHLQVSCSV